MYSRVIIIRMNPFKTSYKYFRQLDGGTVLRLISNDYVTKGGSVPLEVLAWPGTWRSPLQSPIQRSGVGRFPLRGNHLRGMSVITSVPASSLDVTSRCFCFLASHLDPMIQTLAGHSCKTNNMQRTLILLESKPMVLNIWNNIRELEDPQA